MSSGCVRRVCQVDTSSGCVSGCQVGVPGRHVKWVCQVGVSGGCAR